MKVLEDIKQACRESWDGDIGESRAVTAEKFILGFLPSYSEFLGIGQEELLELIDSKRTYNAPNYYQSCNFPSLENVLLFDTQADFRKAAPSGKYICPSCEKVSTNPLKCNASATCQFDARGFFDTLGKGVRIAIREDFLKSPCVLSVFMPVEFLKDEG